MTPIRTTDTALLTQYEEMKARGLSLDLTRGKPSVEQLSLSDAMLADIATHGEAGDYRNYGLIEGIPEARRLFADFLGTKPEDTYVLGSSSLAIMHDIFVQMLLRAVPGQKDSMLQDKANGMRPAYITSEPGYDRHHAICEAYGIELLGIPMTDEGPDLDALDEVMKKRSVRGMWCTPKYSNPSGVTFSRRVSEHLASMPARPSFRIFWDLAYQVHDLAETTDQLPEFLELCKEAGNPDRAFVIGSTSKVTHASAGLAAVASSPANMAWLKQGLSVQNIGPDKLNQLRHVRFLRDMDGVRAHMRKHKAIILPKFEAVDSALTGAFASSNAVRWNKPRGGYFVSLFVKPGTAKRVIEIAAQLGVRLTPAGSAYAYSKDSQDSHIRLAPTFPPLSEVKEAMEVVVLAIRIAAAE